jgi:hypothetical protein
MPLAAENRPKRLNSNLVLEDLADELMIYDERRKRAFCLNQIAAFVWRNSDGEKTVSDLAELMGQQLNAPVNEQAIWLALVNLTKDGLLETPAVMSEEQGRSGRRGIRSLNQDTVRFCSLEEEYHQGNEAAAELLADSETA